MNGLDKVIERLNHAHAYVDVNDKNIFYYVDCSVILDYGQIETFDNEHRPPRNGQSQAPFLSSEGSCNLQT